MRPNITPSPTTNAHDESQPTQRSQTLASLLADRLANAQTAPVHVAPNVISDDVIDVAGVGRMLHVGRNKVYEMVARNEIPHRRFGRRIRFSRAAIMRWLDPCWLQDAKERQ